MQRDEKANKNIKTLKLAYFKKRRTHKEVQVFKSTVNNRQCLLARANSLKLNHKMQCVCSIQLLHEIETITK